MIQKETISYRATRKFSKLILDYLEEAPQLDGLYRYRPTPEGISEALEVRRTIATDRVLLVEGLLRQYQKLDPCNKVKANINALLQERTFTITTGHQLSLFTGPLYFFYKIATAIRLAEEMKKKHPEDHFVPVFWMASEDHDFEEIASFRPLGKKITWEKEAGGAAGHLTTSGLEKVYHTLKAVLGDRSEATALLNMFENAFLKHARLGDATMYLVNELFGATGLVIVDADHRGFKQVAQPIFRKEITLQPVNNWISEANAQLKKGNYKLQATHRNINLFYLGNGLRERIEKEGDVFKVRHTDLVFTETELLQLLKEEPERFSPNVILRPVYQEKLLPNLVYIGGGGELAYWLQIKNITEQYTGFFPVLWLRNSAMFVDGLSLKRLGKLGLKPADLFKDPHELIKEWLALNSAAELDFSEARLFLEKAYGSLAGKAAEIEPGLVSAMQADLQRQLKAFDGSTARLIKAEKKKQEVRLTQIRKLHEKFFPDNGLQERSDHFAAVWMQLGKHFIPTLLEHLDPTEMEFTILLDP